MSGLMSKHMSRDAVNPRHPDLQRPPRSRKSRGKMPTIDRVWSRLALTALGPPVLATSPWITIKRVVTPG